MKKLMIIITLLFISFGCDPDLDVDYSDVSSQQYFGYLGTDGFGEQSYITDLSNSSNVATISSPQSAEDFDHVINLIIEARNNDMKTVLWIDHWLFVIEDWGTSEAKLYLRADYVERWNILSTKLTPYIDSILMFYVLDEPFWNGSHVGISQSDMLATLEIIASTIKTTFPDVEVGSCFGYPSLIGSFEIPENYTMIGFDNYLQDDDVESYFTYYTECLKKFKDKMYPHQRLFLVPGAFQHVDGLPSQNDLVLVADFFYDLFLTEPLVDMMIAFLYPSVPSALIGLDALPELMTKYEEIGNLIIGSNKQENSIFYCGTWNDSQNECIHGNRVILDGYIYFVARSFNATIPAINYHVWKVNIDDFTDYSSANLSYADHGFPNDLFYSKTKDRLYIVYCSIGTKITEVDPETLIITDIVTDMPTSIINASMWIDEEDQQLYITGFYDGETKVYQYNMWDWSLANSFSETPNYGHSVVTDKNYVYITTAKYSGNTTVWRLSKDTLEKVSLSGDGGVHTYTNGDVIGGSHRSRVYYGYLWLGLHGEKGGEEVSAGIVRIDVNDLSSYTKIELPDYNGATYGTTYYNGYLWFTIGTTRHKEAVVKVDPYTLETEVLQTNDEYFYMQGPVTFDYLGRMYLSYMPDFFDEYEAHAGYLVRYEQVESLVVTSAGAKDPGIASHTQKKPTIILSIKEEKFHDLYDKAIDMAIKSGIGLNKDDPYERASELASQAQVIADKLFYGGTTEHIQHLIITLTKSYAELYISIKEEIEPMTKE